MTVAQALEIAVARHQAGALAEAEGIYRQILGQEPGHPDALHMLGLLAYQTRQLDAALGLIRSAIATRPGVAAYHGHLGLVLGELGQMDEAIAAQRRAIELRPDFADAHNNLGNLLNKSGRLAEAVAAYRRAIEFNPSHADAHYNLGNTLSARGEFEQAVEAYRRTVLLRPNLAEAHHNLGLALSQQKRFGEAVDAYRAVTQLQPESAEAFFHMGDAMADGDWRNEAIAAYRAAIQLRPNYAGAWINLGNAFCNRGEDEEAIVCYRRALEIKPDEVLAHYNLGNALSNRCRVGEAIVAFERAVEIEPKFVFAHNNLGTALIQQCRLDEAAAEYRKVLELDPNSSGTRSNLISCLQYHPRGESGMVEEEKARWNERHAIPLRGTIAPHENDRSPERRLRVGYVSSDLRDHVVGLTLLPCFEAHDRAEFEWFCYSGIASADPVAQRFRELASGWCDTEALSNEKLAAKIREDRIDILIDLALHTAGNHLPVFARKPAPVQVSWLGYPGTTGLETIDYHITDPFLDPPGSGEARAFERPLRLPECWCCYRAVEDAPEPGEGPVARLGHVTFGSFNNFAKINEEVLAVWAEILRSVPDSRLVLLTRGCSQSRALGFLEQRGVAPERVELLDYLPGSAPVTCLERYRQIDIALDPFPYNGMTTTCDALWMGVPVVALIGTQSLGRASFSLLSNVGLPELASPTREGYVRTAVELAGDLSRLAGLRATLRERMKGSPLLAPAALARHVETAFRAIWRGWCEGRS